MAELATDPQERAEWLTFVVIGAGPTGVELVGQIAELAHTVLPRDYRSVDTREARIILLEGAGAVLPPFAPKLQRYTHRAAGEDGRRDPPRTPSRWTWTTSRSRSRARTARRRIRARTRIWAAGVQASPLATMLAEKAGVETDRAGRIPVNPDCTLPGHPEVFAIGDMVSLNKLPGVAQPALQEGKYVGKVIKARLAGEPRSPPFKYFDKGSMATIGYKAAVADAFGIKVTGVDRLPHVGVHPRAVPHRLGQPARHALHLVPRLLFSKNRAHRIITFEGAHEELLRPHRAAGKPASPELPGASANATAGVPSLLPAREEAN